MIFDIDGWLWPLLIVGVTSSLVYGLLAERIFSEAPPRWCQRVHQFWLNLWGGIFGWGALLLLLGKFATIGRLPEVGIWDFGLALIAFVGITGHLPMFIIGSYAELRRYVRLIQRGRK